MKEDNPPFKYMQIVYRVVPVAGSCNSLGVAKWSFVEETWNAVREQYDDWRYRGVIKATKVEARRLVKTLEHVRPGHM
jgi:hypothetical protein